MKRSLIIRIILLFQLIIMGSLPLTLQISTTYSHSSVENSKNSIETSVTSPKASSLKYTNATVISDGYNNIWGWNTNQSEDAAIDVDREGNLHVVWDDATPGAWGPGYDNSDDIPRDFEIMYANYSVATGKWSNITVISDGPNELYGWNTNESMNPVIAVDGKDNIHVVWEDYTPGAWGAGGEYYSGGGDSEIMYVLYNSSTSEWSNITIISDGPNEQYGWNDGDSEEPAIAVDSFNNVHVVWEDKTDGIWNQSINDDEIMYVLYNSTTGQWSNITVISDGYNDFYWNNGKSNAPTIAVDGYDNIHVAWEDKTYGKWGDDEELMYAKYSVGTGQWSNVSVISDGYNDVWGWNDEDMDSVNIAADNTGNVYMVWEDWTDGKWGADSEIMYAKYSVGTGQWSNVSVISDGYNNVWGWNDGGSDDAIIAVDGYGNLHVIWEDSTVGPWTNAPSDSEIMYAKCSATTGKWSNASVISDGPDGNYGWNTGDHGDAWMVTYSDQVHVVYSDTTPGIWGAGLDYGDYIPDDSEIMYVKITISPPIRLPSSDDDDDDDDDDEINIVIPTYVLIGVVIAIGIFCTVVVIIMRKRDVLR